MECSFLIVKHGRRSMSACGSRQPGDHGVLQIKAGGQRKLVTVSGHATSVKAGSAGSTISSDAVRLIRKHSSCYPGGRRRHDRRVRSIAAADRYRSICSKGRRYLVGLWGVLTITAASWVQLQLQLQQDRDQTWATAQPPVAVPRARRAKSHGSIKSICHYLSIGSGYSARYIIASNCLPQQLSGSAPR